VTYRYSSFGSTYYRTKNFRNTSITGTVTFVDDGYFSTPARPYSLKPGDLDGDGRLDLAIACSDVNRVHFYTNTSTPGGVLTFQGGPSVSAGTFPRSLALGDFDSDGKLDLAVSHLSSGVIVLGRNTSTIGTISHCNVQFSITIKIG